MTFTTFSVIVILSKEKEARIMELYGMNALGDVYVNYEKYARREERKGRKPVSLWKFALGNF